MNDAIQITDYLRDFRLEPFVYVPNPGNAGDSLIASATYQVFERLGLNYEIASQGNVDFDGRVVVYAGGGNLVKMTTYSARFISLHHSRPKRLVILPHSIKEVDQLLQAFGSNVEIFCRGQTSYDYVSKNVSKAKVYLADDMAFSLDTSAICTSTEYASSPSILAYFFARYVRNESVPALRKIVKAQGVKFIRQKVSAAINDGDFYCFRGDGEATGLITIPPNNVDLSAFLDFGTEDPEVAYFATHHVLSALLECATIHTDRLHIAIGAALLGKTVRFYDNNYGKCLEVYRLSMRDRFPNVIWCSEL